MSTKIKVATTSGLKCHNCRCPIEAGDNYAERRFMVVGKYPDYQPECRTCFYPIADETEKARLTSGCSRPLIGTQIEMDFKGRGG